MNYTNPGAISHNEILELYKQYVDPEITWSNFSLEEQAKVIVAPRSNNLLDTGRARTLACAHNPACARMPGKQLAAGSGACSADDVLNHAWTSAACLFGYLTSMLWPAFACNLGVVSLCKERAAR